MKDPYGERSFKRGLRVSRSFGCEFQANPGSDMREYKDSCAFYFRDDVETFEQLTSKEKTACLIAFAAGRDDERKYQ